MYLKFFWDVWFLWIKKNLNVCLSELFWRVKTLNSILIQHYELVFEKWFTNR